MAKTPDSQVYRAMDRELNGELADVLLTLAEQKFSPEEISRRLYARTEMDVSREAVRRWLDALGIVEAAS